MKWKWGDIMRHKSENIIVVNEKMVNLHLEIGANLRAVFELFLDRCDDKKLDAIGSTIREFLKSDYIEGFRIEKSESEGGSCWDIYVKKIMVKGT